MFCLHFVVVCVEQCREDDIRKLFEKNKPIDEEIKHINDELKILKRYMNYHAIVGLILSVFNFVLVIVSILFTAFKPK